MASASSIVPSNQRQDLKSLLECSICLKTFDDPRTLSCLHSFCKKCLENFVDGKRDDELNCPVCRCKFTLNEGVSGMTRNHFICNMLEVLSIQQNNCIPCSHCQQPSVGRCVTCELFMCEKCLKFHNDYPGFKDHLVLTMEELSKPENQSKIKGKSYCKKHPSKTLKLYCQTCEELICTYCMSFEHVRPDHECSPLEKVAERKRWDLMSICSTLEDEDAYTEFEMDKECAFESCKERLEDDKREIDERETEVLGFVEKLLKRRTKLLTEEMDKMYKDKLQEISEKVTKIEGQFEERKKTSIMAKALLDHGSDEEIVLSHKSIQQNAAKKYQCLWHEVNVEISPYTTTQLFSLFLDGLRSIKEETLASQSEKVIFKVATPRARQKTESAQPREKVHFDPSTGKLMVAKNQLRNFSTDSNTISTNFYFGPCCDITEKDIN